MSLPAADDLFRPTSTADEASAPEVRAPEVGAPQVGGSQVRAADAASAPQDTEQPPTTPGTAEEAARKPSGRVRHDEKMTVYVTADELMDLEHARLSLRRSHALAVDRGRMVREAVAIALADLEENGEDSVIVRRLRDS